MSFPTTSVLDNFNRADTVDITGSLSWISPLFGHTAFGILSNQVENAGSNSNNVWNGSYTDAEVYITLVDTIYGVNKVALGVRFDSNPNGYFLYWNQNNGTQYVRFYRYDSGAATQLGADISVSFSAGAKLGLSIVGSTLTAYADTGSGWASIGTRTDATYASAGNLWLYGFNDSATWLCDDFGGGEVVAASTLFRRSEADRAGSRS